ncbi:MAG: ABC transporter substrate-binding protein [Eubacteriales bacterium]|nr:ABC transporter substrate-binding protein [Eubacteriales bacterium]
MKKKVLSVLCACTMVFGLAACGSDASTSTPAADADTSAAVEETDAGEEETDAGSAAGTGSVYLLNFKPETDDAWQALAKVYTEQTGVEVNVLTAADGQYKTTLQSELAKSEAPTIFTIGSNADCAEYANYIYDLSDSALYEHLTDKSLSLSYDGKVAAVANCYESYGIIYNKTILQSYIDNYEGAVISSIDEIDNFETLKAVAEDINANVDAINEACGTELTEAFASSGLDSGSNWRFSGHLAGIALYYEFKDAGCDLIAGQGTVTGDYLDNFKAVWDLYVSTSAADPATLDSGALNAEQELGLGEAVFYQNGDWEFAALTNPENGYTVTAEDLSMMPIYFGVDDATEGLAVGTENYWAVNAQASQEDIDSTLAFLEWVITSDEGRNAINKDMGLTAPFDTFTGDFASQNQFAAKVNDYAAAGKTSVAWSFSATPAVDDWRADFIAALTEYTERGGSWDDVVTAYVDQWAYYWDLQNAE